MHDKLLKAGMMAHKIKSIARSIEFDANDYDCRWPLRYAKELNDLADEYLKLK